LESVCAGNRTVGSNPTLSAISPAPAIYTSRPSRPSATPFHRWSLPSWRCGCRQML